MEFWCCSPGPADQSGAAFLNWKSPRAHLHVVGMLQFMPDINQLSLPTPFYSVLVSVSVFMALSTVFHSIHSPNNSALSHRSSGLISALLVLSTVYLFMKVSFSPDRVLCGWLGSKHQLTNWSWKRLMFNIPHKILIHSQYSHKNIASHKSKVEQYVSSETVFDICRGNKTLVSLSVCGITCSGHLSHEYVVFDTNMALNFYHKHSLFCTTVKNVTHSIHEQDNTP